jgi:hypothetical protein
MIPPSELVSKRTDTAVSLSGYPVWVSIGLLAILPEVSVILLSLSINIPCNIFKQDMAISIQILTHSRITIILSFDAK